MATWLIMVDLRLLPRYRWSLPVTSIQRLEGRWQWIQCKHISICRAVRGCAHKLILILRDRSRAVAVAAYQDNLDVFIMNPSVSRTSFMPVHSVCLYPSSHYHGHIIYLLCTGFLLSDTRCSLSKNKASYTKWSFCIQMSSTRCI